MDSTVLPIPRAEHIRRRLICQVQLQSSSQISVNASP